jgi:hypothetical protein
MKKFLLLLLLVCSSFSLFAKGKYSEDDIGKIVLQNGKLVSIENYDKSSYEAVAIVYSIAKDGSYFLGIGINTIEAQWATKDSYGYLGRIEKLEDLKDGYKAFDIVKEKDPNGFKNLEKNYPALYFASTYGKRYNVGKYKDGWYIPTFEESGNEFYLPCSSWTQMRKIISAFEIFNDWPSYFWCSNSDYKENSYDSYWGGYFWDKLPADMKFSVNRKSAWVESGAYPYYNTSKYTVVVFRKFN